MAAHLTVRRAMLVVGLVALGVVLLVRLVSASGTSSSPGPVPVDLSRVGEDAADAQIAVDGRGTSIAVWTSGLAKTATGKIVERPAVRSAVRPAGGGWRAPTDLSAGQPVYRAQIAVNARGSAVAVWERQRDGNLVVQSAVRPAGGSWGAVTNLSAPGRACGRRTGVTCRASVGQVVYREMWPRVVIDRRGNAAASWERSIGGRSRVQVAVRPAGGRWRAAVDVVRLARTRHTDVARAQIALGPGAEAIAVWMRTRAEGRVVQAAVRRPRGGWRAPVDVSAVGRNVSSPQVAFDARGRALAVWEMVPGATVQGASRAPNGDWTRPVDISAAGVHATGPDLAVDQRGGAVAVWNRLTDDGATVQAADWAPSGTWQAPADISAGEPGTSAGSPDIALNSSGDAVAAWVLALTNRGEGEHGLPDVVQGAMRPAGGTWQARSWRGADRVTTRTQVAADPLGRMVAIWERFDPRPGGYITARSVTVP